MSLRISIPDPCQEDWNAMTPTDNGRYCSVCAHEVPDLSKRSDEELSVLALRDEMPKCARFAKGQLDRAIVPHTNPVMRLQALVLAAAMITVPAIAAEPDSTKADADTVAKKSERPEKKKRKKSKKKRKAEGAFSELQWPMEGVVDGRIMVTGAMIAPQEEHTFFGFSQIESQLPHPPQIDLLARCGEVPSEAQFQAERKEAALEELEEKERERKEQQAHPALLAVFFRHQRLGAALRKLRATVFGKRLRS